MRAVFGVVGLLGLLVALVWFFSAAYLPYTQQVVTSGQSAQSTAQQLAGIDAQAGGRVSDNVRLAPISRGNRLIAMQVESVTPGSSYQAHFGIQPNDMIEQIGPQSVRDIGDEEMARSLAYEAFQRKWDLVVMRNGRRFTLPQDAAAANAAAGAQVITPASPTPAAPAQAGPQPNVPAPRNPNNDGTTPLQRQLDAITNYGL